MFKQTYFTYLSIKNELRCSKRNGNWKLNSLQNIKDVKELIEVKHIVGNADGHSEYEVDVKTGQRIFKGFYDLIGDMGIM